MLEGGSFAGWEVGCEEWKDKAWLKGLGIESESIQRLKGIQRTFSRLKTGKISIECSIGVRNKQRAVNNLVTRTLLVILYKSSFAVPSTSFGCIICFILCLYIHS